MLQKIKEEIKVAMKNKDPLKRNILRMILANSNNIAKNDGNRETKEEDILSALKRQVKQNKETVEFAKKEGRDHSKESKEIEILENYLPQKIDKNILEAFVSAQIIKLLNEGTNIKASIGRIMGLIKKEYGASVDMKEAKEILDRKTEELTK